MLAHLRTTPAFFLRPIAVARSYRREDLRPDLIAGLTVGIVLLPQGLAFSLLAGLPPQMGLYAATVASIVGGLWGSSHHLQTGPTNTASALVLATLLPIAAAGSPEFIVAAGMLALLAGLIRLAMGTARLGMLVNFVSDSVAVGFTAGAGILIMIGQFTTLLRLPASQAPDVLGQLANLLFNLPQAHLATLVVGVVTIVLILTLQKLYPQLSPVLVSMIIVGLLVWGLALNQRGVQVLGELPRGLPPLAPLPLLDLDLIGKLMTGALAIAAIGLVEAAAISRAIAGHSGQRLDSNQEFVGQGLANIVAGVFSGYPCSGSFNRSALSYRAGGRTGITAVFSGVFVFAATSAFGPLAAHLPRAALAAALLITAYGMIDRHTIARILRGARGDAVIMVVTLTTTLFLPLPFAVLTGILMSLAYYILQTSMPRVQPVLPADRFRHWVYQPDKPPCPQLAVLDLLGDLYFGAVSHIEDEVREHMARNPEQRFLLLRMHSVLRCDISGIHALENIVRAYRANGGDVYMVRVRDSVREFMRSTGFYDEIGASHFLDEDQAIGFLFYKILDPAICIYECPVRAFKECQNLPKRTEVLEIPHRVATLVGDLVEVAPQELWRQLKDTTPPLAIDVREPREYQQGHIPQAWNLPLARLLAEEPLNLPLDTPLVLVCRGGRRSTRAAALLRAGGFTNIAVLQGGMLAWEAADLLEAVGEGVASLTSGLEATDGGKPVVWTPR
jgi:SulP family sulfate permease